MKKYRLIYAILWILTIVTYSIPWASIDGKTYVGWNFTLPFSITYVIGILLGLIILIGSFKPVTMTIAAGTLMLLGLAGATFGYGAMAALAGFTEAKVTREAGMGSAFTLSIIYMIAEAYAGKKMVTKKTPREDEESTQTASAW